MPIFSCSAILFDLDGVLVDSTRAVDREWREWARRKGVDGNAVMAIAHGVRTIEVIRRVAPHLDADAEAWEIENEEANDQQGVHVMPGAVALERSIPEGRWGVVTSGPGLAASGAVGRGDGGDAAAGKRAVAFLRVAGSDSSSDGRGCVPREAASGAVFKG